MSMSENTSMSSEYVTAFFDSEAEAEAAVARIEAEGVPRDQIRMVAGGLDAGIEAGTAAAEPRSKDRIHPQAVARAVSDLAARDAAFVFDTGLNTLWSGNWIRQNPFFSRMRCSA